MLGPDCVLVRRTAEGYRCLNRDEAAALQVLLLVKGDPDWLFRCCRRIAEALADNEIALAQIYGLHIPINELDNRDLRLLAAAAPLIKANFDPDEPRDWHGRWTDEGGAEPEKPSPDWPHSWPGTMAGSAAVAGEAAAGSLLGALPAETLSALARFAARFTAATATLGLLFFPANRRPISDGAIAGRPDARSQRAGVSHLYGHPGHLENVVQETGQYEKSNAPTIRNRCRPTRRMAHRGEAGCRFLW